jgi:RsmE family RNA methyltransferase
MIDLRDLKKRVRELYIDEDQLFIACDLNNNDYDLNDQLKLSKVICVIVGPEGGFSSRDYQEFNNLSVKYLNLGRNTLRAETASIASLALITAQLRLK